MEDACGADPGWRRVELAKSLALAEGAAKAMAGRFGEPLWFCVLMGMLAGIGVTLLHLDGAGFAGAVVVGIFVALVSVRAIWRGRRVRDRPPLTHGRSHMWWVCAMLLLMGPVPMLTAVDALPWVLAKLLLLSAAFTLVYFKLSRAALRQAVKEGWVDDTF
ncbi:hypothetical protein [Paeniglutamicibacter cryotolerans]|uniref:Uncharacterized protein n=1 Tax=Paeniglutamicibacter cryotolerans TaxID=670079 RepID=A0A839QI62_9MICC|nr:hypothetical protein [Paeniglutamicibacter cryotolerans]MBB2995467.1 hypothetical protein [Paeniglutamicibacter cryotolerans]